MSALLCLVAGAVFAYVVVYYGLFRAARCTWSGTLSGKTAVVTGNEFHTGDAGSSLWEHKRTGEATINNY